MRGFWQALALLGLSIASAGAPEKGMHSRLWPLRPADRYPAHQGRVEHYMYTLAFEPPKKGVILALLSPGEVNTVDAKGMERPGLIETDESVSKMLKVIDGLTPEQNGQFLDHEDGQILGW